MVLIKVKGHEFNTLAIKDSFNRKAEKFYNNIHETLRQIGLTEDDILVELERVPIKNAPASASWYYKDYHLHYSYKGCSKYVENLYVVSKLIGLEVYALLEGRRTEEEFIRDFSEERDITEQRIAAREHLGLPADELDLNLINKTYKKMSLSVHPDMPNGDEEKFKALNKAHKILKRELE